MKKFSHKAWTGKWQAGAKQGPSRHTKVRKNGEARCVREVENPQESAMAGITNQSGGRAETDETEEAWGSQVTGCHSTELQYFFQSDRKEITEVLRREVIG